jgi:hypothetical protein
MGRVGLIVVKMRFLQKKKKFKKKKKKNTNSSLSMTLPTRYGRPHDAKETWGPFSINVTIPLPIRRRTRAAAEAPPATPPMITIRGDIAEKDVNVLCDDVSTADVSSISGCAESFASQTSLNVTTYILKDVW